MVCAPTPRRALMVSLEQEESVDLVELRENLALLAPLDLLDSLDLLLVAFTSDNEHLP